MTSRERLLAALDGSRADHVPLTTWSFGLSPPERLRWKDAGQDREFWYSMRMEHLHTLRQPWRLEDDFKRVEAWFSLGVDDVLDVSVPWSAAPEVTWQDTRVPPRRPADPLVLVREYETPAGPIRHVVRATGEEPGDGWPVQPDHVPLFEDYNIPRAAEHPVSVPGHVAAVEYLYGGPDEQAERWFAGRMVHVERFAREKGVLVQAWSAFGMDAAVWLMGAEGAVVMAMAEPEAFGRLVERIAQTDYERTKLAVSSPCVDVVAMRGWYSSTDFWSPDLFDQYVVPHIQRLATLAHEHGKKFAYVMTTGVELLGSRLADAGVDVLYFVDPVQDAIPLEQAREILGGRMTLVGGINTLSLSAGHAGRIGHEVQRAIEVLGPTNRFILHPVDALFPDTPWEGVEQMIEAWERFR